MYIVRYEHIFNHFSTCLANKTLILPQQFSMHNLVTFLKNILTQIFWFKLKKSLSQLSAYFFDLFAHINNFQTKKNSMQLKTSATNLFQFFIFSIVLFTTFLLHPFNCCVPASTQNTNFINHLKIPLILLE
jgi:hypothetical protein